jgi:hypothetical protein
MEFRDLRMKHPGFLLAIGNRLAGGPEAEMCGDGLLGEKIDQMRKQDEIAPVSDFVAD